MEISDEESKVETGKGTKQLTKPPPIVLTEQEQVMLQDSQTSAFIGELGSQETQGYHLALDSASHPAGYRFQMPKHGTGLHDLQHLFWGEGSFYDGEGGTKNLIQMISESFVEAFALRKLVEKGLDEVSAETKAMEAQLNGKIKAMTEESNRS